MFSLICPECAGELSLSPRRLMLRVAADPSGGGELLFTCLSCAATPTVSLGAADLAVLIRGGVSHVCLPGAGLHGDVAAERPF